MNYFFDNIAELDGVNGFEMNSYMTHAYNKEYDFTLVKHNDFYWVEMNEEEGDYLEQDNRIYEIGTKWYMRFDYDRFVKDYYFSTINHEDFYVEEYELNIE